MTRKPSAAQRAAEFFLQKQDTASYWYYNESRAKEIAKQLLREDRERRRMERAILAWAKNQHGDMIPEKPWTRRLWLMAQKMKGKKP